MSRKYDYDILVIGGGAAGLSAAFTSAGFGKKTALIEQRKTGGECTWNGCIPSKALIRSANTVFDAVQSKNEGHLGGDISVNTPVVMESVRKIIQSVYQGEDNQTLEKAGISVITAHAELADRHTVKADGRMITAGRIILALGSAPFVPPIEGLKPDNCLTNENFFELKKIPGSLIVLGGGPIGVELAQAASRLGSKVTIVEMNDRLLFREDTELTELLEKQFVSEGITLLTGTKAVKYEKKENQVILTVEFKDGQRAQVAAEDLLCAVGRSVRTAGAGLEAVGVKYTRQGIITDKFMQTSVPGIFACGDIVGSYQFSHVAGNQGVTAALNSILPFKTAADSGSVLWTTYTDPELSRIGMTEADAVKKFGKKVRIVKVSFEHLDRAVTERKTNGLAKFILDRKGRILGAHIFGASAGEVIHEAALLKKLGKPLAFARNYLHAYPSYSDIIAKAAKTAIRAALEDNPIVKLFRGLTKIRKRNVGGSNEIE